MAKFYLKGSNCERLVKTTATTLLGAKREASNWVTYDKGSVMIMDADHNEICYRELWSNLNRFGWSKWQTL